MAEGLLQINPHETLKTLFGIPPFTTLNTREGDWQARKRMWTSLGIQSEVGRKDGLTYKIPKTLSDGRKARHIEAQTSIFDPYLTELIYRWWCPTAGVILDPFAGGSVRGIVASVLDRKYCGIELREEQVLANREQLGPGTTGKWKPKWMCEDSGELAAGLPKVDFVFSCPPYGDLEKYSDDPRDISTLRYEDFLVRYREIIRVCVDRLENDRFASFVVCNFRDAKAGRLRDFVGDTIRTFEDAGAEFYNEAVLLNCTGTNGMRANGTFLRGARKLVRAHQNVLGFVKGDPKKVPRLEEFKCKK